jgi:alanine dehydrogenase
LAPLRAEFGDRVRTLLIAEARLPSLAADADVLVGAVNVPGGATPKLLSIAEVAGLQPGSVLIEICIDGGGIAATSRPTSHAAPTYVEQGVIHYCVPNMPAAAPRSASTQLSAALLGTLQSLCSLGLLRAMRDNDGLAAGLQMHGGQITRPDVAAQLGLPFLDVDAMLFSC